MREVIAPTITLVTLAVLPFFSTDYLTTVLFQALLWAYLGSSWNILGGFTGQFSLGHAAFLGIGAYSSMILLSAYGVTPWIGMIVGGGLAALVGAAIGLISMRLGTVFFALATIALAEMMKLVFLYLRPITGGPLGIVLAGGDPTTMVFSSPSHYYWLTLGLLASIIGFSYWLKRSKFGLNLQAIRDDEDAAKSLGINPLRHKVAASGISAFFTAIGGTIMAQWLLYVRPDVVFKIDHSILMAVTAIIGGPYHPLGPLLGSLLVVPASLIINSLLGGKVIGLNVMVYGFLLIISPVFMREGIYPWIRDKLVRIR